LVFFHVSFWTQSTLETGVRQALLVASRPVRVQSRGGDVMSANGNGTKGSGDARADQLIYDWNEAGSRPERRRVGLNDETLRDGLQSPSVLDPRIEEKIEILHLMDRLRIDTADLGLPGED